MGFVPIELRDYVRLHLKSNPRERKADLVERLQATLKEYKSGKLCACGEPIWVIGSAEVGHMCFTCITGEADPSDDYEIAEACGRSPVRREHRQRRNRFLKESAPIPRSAQGEQPPANPARRDDELNLDITDDDVPF